MTRRSPARWCAVMLGTTVVASALLAPVAAADDGPPDSAVSQYVETVPTSEGSVAVGARNVRRAALSPTVTQQLSAAGPTGAALKAVASSSSYGAPTTPLGPRRSGPADRATIDDRERESPSIGSALGSTVEATGSAADARLGVLLVVLALTTVAAVGVRARGSR
jgi:hypothetical protein